MLLQRLAEDLVHEPADLVAFGFCHIDEAGNKGDISTGKPGIYDMEQANAPPVSYNVWAKLISRRLLIDKHIRFEPIRGEDALFSIALYCHAGRVLVTDDVYYCYRSNPPGSSKIDWHREKIFGTVDWFSLAIPLIRGSTFFERHPKFLQSVITERLVMLFRKLGVLVVDGLNEEEQRAYFTRWRMCLEYYDSSYFDDQFCSHPEAGLYREMLDLLLAGDSNGLDRFFKRSAYRRETVHGQPPVTLDQQQALRLGKTLLQIKNPGIRCDFAQASLLR